MGNMLSLFQTKKETLIMFQKDKFWEKQKMYLWETWKKHIICFSDFSFRNTFCVSVGKTLWKSQNVSLNGFSRGNTTRRQQCRHSWLTWGIVVKSNQHSGRRIWLFPLIFHHLRDFHLLKYHFFGHFFAFSAIFEVFLVLFNPAN